MPTYDYVCDNEDCGHEFELFQMMSDKVKRKCPECGKLKLRRLIGGGSGIVITGTPDYVYTTIPKPKRNRRKR